VLNRKFFCEDQNERNNMKNKLSLVAVVGSVLIMPFGAAAGLILNGDFEQPVQGSSSSPSQFLPVGSSIPGWLVVGTGGVNVDQTFSPTPYWPGNSSQFMDLTGNSGGGGVRSDSLATVAGQVYTVTFDAMNGSTVFSTRGAFSGYAFSLQATGGPLVSYSLAAGQIANSLTYTFTATGGDQLTFMDLTEFDSNAGWIDNVRISAVPEPTTVIAGALLLLPFGASTIRILRKKTAA
jgi:hypothetical protein